MNRLVSVLDLEDVKVGVFAESTLALFIQAALIFQRHRGIRSLSSVTDTLIERERLASTCLGHGVAIPHGRLKGLASSIAAVVRLSEPLNFRGPDDQAVDLFVFLLVPEMAAQEDLEILAEIAEMLSDKAVRERLRHDVEANDVYATIAGWTPVGATQKPLK